MKYILALMLTLPCVVTAQDDWQTDYNTWQLNNIRNQQLQDNQHRNNAEYYRAMEQNRRTLIEIQRNQREINRALREIDRITRDPYKWDDEEVAE